MTTAAPPPPERRRSAIPQSSGQIPSRGKAARGEEEPSERAEVRFSEAPINILLLHLIFRRAFVAMLIAGSTFILLGALSVWLIGSMRFAALFLALGFAGAATGASIKIWSRRSRKRRVGNTVPMRASNLSKGLEELETTVDSMPTMTFTNRVRELRKLSATWQFSPPKTLSDTALPTLENEYARLRRRAKWARVLLNLGLPANRDVALLFAQRRMNDRLHRYLGPLSHATDHTATPPSQESGKDI